MAKRAARPCSGSPWVEVGLLQEGAEDAPQLEVAERKHAEVKAKLQELEKQASVAITAACSQAEHQASDRPAADLQPGDRLPGKAWRQGQCSQRCSLQLRRTGRERRCQC